MNAQPIAPNTLLDDLHPSRFLKVTDLLERWKIRQLTVTVSRLANEETTPNPKDIDPATKQPRVVMQPVLYFKTKTGEEFPRGYLLSAKVEGLFDYQTNNAVDKWLKDKVLLPPATTRCAVPKDAAGQGMLRAIAYGTELNMAYPPRPTDPATPWEPDWNIKIRVKSMTTTMMGMEGAEGMGGMGGMDSADEMTDAPEPGSGQDAATPADQPKKKKKFNPFDAVKDIVKELP